MSSIIKRLVDFLLCRKTPLEKSEVVKRISFSRLAKFATTANLLTFLLGCLCSVIGGIIQNLVLVFGGWMITTYMIHGKAFDEHLVEEIKPNLIFLLIFAFIQFVITFIENYCLATSAVNVVGKIRKDYLAAVLRQDSDWWESKPPGAITLELNDNIEVIKDGLGSKVGMMIRGVSMYVSSLIMCSIINWRLTAIFMPIGPITAFTLGLTQKVYGKYSDEVNELEQDAASILEEVVLNVKTVQLCNAQEHFVEKYRRKVSESLSAILKINFWLGFIDGMTYLESVFIIGMFYWIAIPMYHETKLVKDPGDIILILNVLSVSCYCLSMLGYQMSAISKAWITASNVCETIDRPSSIDQTSVSPIKGLQGKITFSNVRFKYNSRTEEILRGLTLSAEPGQSIALVGESGCGKSTALQLLTRMYSPLSGEIEIDEVNLEKICPQSWRKSIGVVEQRSCLISGSIADNIRFGRKNISDEAVEEAAKIANAHEFVAKLDKGYDTLVGEGALKLSGGQKQRIAIARAVLTNPTILLLDEATSALDTQSEKIVQNALNAASKGRTTVIIAHRLSTLKDVDKIYVLKEGVVVESGSHPELLKQDGIYASLARTQDVETNPEDKAIEKLPKQSIRQSSPRRSSKLSRRSFSKEPANKSEEISDENSGMMLLFRNLSANLNVALPALICSVIRGFDVPLMCLSVFLAFKALENADNYKENMYYAIFEVVVAGILILLVQIMMYVLASCTAEKVLNSLKVKALRSLLYRPMAYFDRESPATCVVSIIQNAPTCKAALDTSMGMNIAGMTAVAIGLVVGLIYVWQISVLTAVWCILLYILIFCNLHYSNLAQRMKSTKDKSAELAVELIENVRSVQIFAVEDYFVEKFGIEQRRAKALDRRIILIDAINFALTQSSIFFNEFSMNLISTYLVYYGYYDVKTVFLGLECAQVSSYAVLVTAPFFPDIIKACSSSRVLAEYVDDGKVIDVRLKMGDKPKIDGAVKLENIKFAYPSRPDVLVTKNLTISAKKNEKIALVGPSGGGKSTVLNLLTKLYSPLSGSVTIDGVQVDGINNGHLRNNVAVVGQEPVLFKGTIKENITMGDEEIGMDMVEKACKTANALNFIDAFPEKFDTDVGEGGNKLSGGQRQRIAIARAIVKMPKILLLDEATAALDAESEEKVNSALSSAVKNITSITIAHRLKTVQQSDRIYVVENGRIVESGSHMELMENGGHYVALVKAQKLLNDE